MITMLALLIAVYFVALIAFLARKAYLDLHTPTR